MRQIRSIAYEEVVRMCPLRKWEVDVLRQYYGKSYKIRRSDWATYMIDGWNTVTSIKKNNWLILSFNPSDF